MLDAAGISVDPDEQTITIDTAIVEMDTPVKDNLVIVVSPNIGNG